VCSRQEGHCEKDDPRWQARNGCDGRLGAHFYNDNSGEFIIITVIKITGKTLSLESWSQHKKLH